MSSKTPSLTAKELIHLLESKGFILDISSGSHHIYRMSDGSKRVIVPLHNKDLPQGTLHSILRQAGNDKKEL